MQCRIKLLDICEEFIIEGNGPLDAASKAREMMDKIREMDGSHEHLVYAEEIGDGTYSIVVDYYPKSRSK